MRLSKQHFWEWFRRYNREYLALRNKQKKEATYLLNELNAHLRAYFKFFGFSLEWRNEQTARLMITVNGKACHFKKVDDLVAKAPKIPAWTIVALEDPRPVNFLLEQLIEGSGIDPHELSFSFESDDPHNTVLTVYHPLCNPENEHLIYQLATGAVFNLLGERSFGTDIGCVHVANLSCADSADVQGLEHLPACIGYGRSDMVIDNQGHLVKAG